MKIISFDGNTNNKILRDDNQDGLFDLFQKNIVNSQNIPVSIYIVPREYEMRLDRISNHIYGSPSYVEELMVLNDIINPYSVKEGQYIYFCQMDYLQSLYVKDEIPAQIEKARLSLINATQPNKDRQNIEQGLSTTIKPSSLKQVKVSSSNNIKIINSFQ
jgi:hypothetical protein